MVIKNAFLIFLVLLLVWCEYLLTFNNPYHHRHYYPVHLLSNILAFILIQQSLWKGHVHKHPFIYSIILLAIIMAMFFCCPSDNRKSFIGRVFGIFLLIIFNSNNM